MAIFSWQSFIRIGVICGIVGLIVGIPLFLLGQFDTFLDAAHLRFWIRTGLPPLSESPRHVAPDISALPTVLDYLVVVAHYDDEALAASGFLTREIEQGKKVGVVVVTMSQGEAPAQRDFYGIQHHYSWLQWKYIYGFQIRPIDRTRYAEYRKSETEAVLDLMGVPPSARLFLHYPDQKVDQLINELDQPIQGDYFDPVSGNVEQYTDADLKQTILTVIQQTQPATIITHFPDDTNSDHRAIGRLVDDLVLKHDLPTRVLTFLVHWNHRDAAWAPEQYTDELAWVRVLPDDLFVPPAGSPAELAETTETIEHPWPIRFSFWKRQLLERYHSQVLLYPLFAHDYGKENELLWDVQERRLIDIRFPLSQ